MCSHMILKQNHWAPTCAIPNNPAKHSKEFTILQHATSAREFGKMRMFAKLLVADVVPKRMK